MKKIKVGFSVVNRINNKIGIVDSIHEDGDRELIYLIKYSDGIKRFTRREYLEVINDPI